MDGYTFITGLLVEAVLLALEGQEKSCGDQGNGDSAAQVHIGECTQQTAADKPQQEGANSPTDELSFEPPVHKRPLEPLVYGVSSDH